MKAKWRIALLLWFAVAPTTTAELSQEDLMNKLPSCATTCLLSSFGTSECLPTNRTCTCSDEQFQSRVTQCVKSGCTIKESLTTKNLTMTYCGAPIRDQSQQHVILTNVIGTVALVCILQRLFFKYWWGLDSGLDDWIILLTGLMSIPNLTVTQYGAVPNGLGRDIWTVPFESITAFGVYFYFLAVNYFAQMVLLKMVLLLFYLRIFPARETRLVILGTIVFNGMVGMFFVFLAAFQCQPVSYFWTKWDEEHKGQCLSINSIAWSNAAVGIALDIWMLLIPLSQLQKLQLDWKKKVGAGLMFFVGTFVTVISIVRLQFLVKFGKTDNNTWDYIEVTRWSVIEIAVAEICTCMPSIRVVLVRMFPRLSGATSPKNSHVSSGKSDLSGDHPLKPVASPSDVVSETNEFLQPLARLSRVMQKRPLSELYNELHDI